MTPGTPEAGQRAFDLAYNGTSGVERYMPKKGRPLEEASLDDMLADPIVWTVMRADGVDEHDLRDLLKNVAADLAAGNAGMSKTSPASDSAIGYRRGVGIMLLSERNRVFVGQRADTREDAWQMPQGGIDDDEEPREAAFRELREEIGTDNAQVVAESKTWLRYDLPPELRERWKNRWRGQQQKWFVMRFQGNDSDINVATEHPEFTAWKWVPAGELVDIIVSFKRRLYLDLLQELHETGALSRDSQPRPLGQ